MATNGDIYAHCCDLLLDGHSEWIRRRKETAEIITESLLRHCLSLDFLVDDLPMTRRNNVDLAFVPLTLIRKEPGAFTRFDFRDEGGRSIPLPNRTANARISAGVLRHAAGRVLGTDPSPELAAELTFIASRDKDLAVAAVNGAYKTPEGPVAQDADAENREKLWQHDRFRWLVLALARSSILVASFPVDERPRRVLKLTYDEHIEDVTALRAKPLEGKLLAISSRLGWRGYLLEVFSPFIGGSSYHFELHAPDGMELVASGLSDGRRSQDDRSRVHLYVDDARLRTSSVAWAQFRIRGPGFVGAAALTSTAILVSLGIAIWQAPQLVDTNTSAPALLLLFPGLVAAYLARPTHPLVTRLLNLARFALVLCTAAAYLAAGRLALVSSVHPTDKHSLSSFFIACALVAAVCSGALLASWRLPRPLRRLPPPKKRAR